MPLKKFTSITLVTLFGVSLFTLNTTIAADDDYGIIRINDNLKPTPDPYASGTQGNVVQSQAVSNGNVVYQNGMNQFPSPFKQWAAPTTHPIHPGFFYYTRAYPDHWYGSPQPARRRTAHVIQTPTDTTQLGYYYQHVPVWQPNPSMIPPEPHPATWHNWKKLPPNVVWNRRGVGAPKGVVNPPGHPFVRGTVVKQQGKPAKKIDNKPPIPPSPITPEAP